MTKTKVALTPLEHAHIGLKILELLEPVHSNEAKLSILEAAELMVRASDAEAELADGYPYRIEDDEDDDCDLCDQEAELEAGSFTPHEHSNGSHTEFERAHSELDRLLVPR